MSREYLFALDPAQRSVRYEFARDWILDKMKKSICTDMICHAMENSLSAH